MAIWNTSAWMRNLILVIFLGCALFLFVESWSCQPPIGRVYSRSNPPVAIEFDFSRIISSISGYRIYDLFSRVLIQDNNGLILAKIKNGYLNQRFEDEYSVNGVDVKYIAVDKVQMTINTQGYLKAGTYRLSSWISSGDLIICNCLFLLGVPTKPTISMGNNPAVGESVTLTCASNSTTTPSNHTLNLVYNWIVDGVNNPTDSRFAYDLFGKTLTFFNIAKTDSLKQFTCTATENVTDGYTSEISDSKTIVVLYGPEKMRFNSGDENIERDENTLLPEVLCEADCYPPCSFKWTKLESGSVVASTASLQLRWVTRRAAGTYRCTASTSSSELATKDFILKVLYAPSVSITTYPSHATLNQDLKIVCEANDGVPAEYRYTGIVHTYKGQLIQITYPAIHGRPLNSSLHILSAQLRDTGTYTCYANNGVNTSGTLDQIVSVEVNMKAIPLLLLEENILFGTENEPLTVNIPFYSYLTENNVTIKRFDGLEITGSSKYDLMYSRSLVENMFYHTMVALNCTVVRFIINNLTKEDLTKYVVLVANEVGYNSVEISIMQKGPPLSPVNFKASTFSSGFVLLWDSRSNGGDEQSFLIQASTDSTGQWSNITLVQESDKEHLISEGHYITNVSGLPHGIYLCRIIAFNSFGNASPVILPTQIEINIMQEQHEVYSVLTMWLDQDNRVIIIWTVLGLIIIGLVICITIQCVKVRRPNITKGEVMATNPSGSGIQLPLQVNAALQQDTAQQVDASSYVLPFAVSQYRTLDDRLNNDTRVYEVISTDT